MLYGIIEGLALAGRAQTVVLPTAGAELDAGFASRIDPLVQSGRIRVTRVKTALNRFATETLYFARPSSRSTLEPYVLSPNYFTAPTIPRRLAVSSILDLQYLHFPEFFSSTKRAWLRLAHQHTLRRARVVTCISEYVREDILEKYETKREDSLVTIPVPISWSRFDHAVRPVSLKGLSGPYILAVASHYPHKNLATLVRAFCRVAERIPHSLVLVGQDVSQLVGTVVSGAKSVKTMQEVRDMSGRILFTGHIADSEVAWAYRNAAAFAFPSLFEGFGMPVVEALGLGLPVLTTRCGAIPEVSLGLASYVDDPLDEVEMSERLLAMVSDTSRFAPSAEDVMRIRDRYAPRTVAEALLRAIEST